MTDLERQAEAYSKTRLMAIEDYEDKCWNLRTEMELAYIQGWVDCDTRDMRPETPQEFFDDDCAAKT